MKQAWHIGEGVEVMDWPLRAIRTDKMTVYVCVHEIINASSCNFRHEEDDGFDIDRLIGTARIRR